MNYICKFVGGRLHGGEYPVDKVRRAMAIDFTEDLTAVRARGGCVHRKELDNQPIVDGYLSPMWDGTKNVAGQVFGVLRYETQEVYDMLSH